MIRPHHDVGERAIQRFAVRGEPVPVSPGEGSREYGDPVEFFQRTYLTEGLRDLLAGRCGGSAGDENAAPVINLQTNFGGGKTHSMLALYHLFSGMPLSAYPQDLQELLDGSDLGGSWAGGRPAGHAGRQSHLPPSQGVDQARRHPA